MPRPRSPARVVGPHWLPSRGEYRVTVHRGDGTKRSRRFGQQAEAEAIAYAHEARRSLAILAEIKLSATLIEYQQHLLVNRRNKPRSVEDTLYRLRRFFAGPDATLRSFTAGKCRALYEELTTKRRAIKLKDGKTKEGELLSADSRMGILSTVKTFFAWCVAKVLISANPAAGIRDEGTRNHGGIGNTVLRAKELRALFARAHEKASVQDERALGVLMALVLGMRSGEIVRCQARDIDDVRWILEIPIESAKTKASCRVLALPEVLQPLLAARLRGRRGEQYVFGDGDKPHDRGWVSDTVRVLCTELRFPKIESAHGLRGAHNDLARQAGSTGDEVVRQLGHESESTTRRSYTSRMGREAISTGHQNRVLGVLAGGKAG